MDASQQPAASSQQPPAKYQSETAVGEGKVFENYLARQWQYMKTH